MATYSPKHAPGSSPQTAYTTPASTTLFRRLVWEGTVPLEIRIDPKELPAGSDRGLESYYVQAPRVSYLPLLIPDIKRHLAELVLDDQGAKFLKEEDWWFEAEGGVLMKWHWPLGLLYDHYSTSVSPAVASSSAQTTHYLPFRLTLHFAAPPVDKLLLSPSIEACKQAFMGQLKEADFLRWGSTKRVTGLRKPEHDGLWDGVRDHNFDDYWRVASKITPTTTPTTSPPVAGIAQSSQSALYRPSSTEPGSHAGHTGTISHGTLPHGAADGAYSVRNVPVKLYLPDGGPVLQEPIAPLDEAGRPLTLGAVLHRHLPLLFPSEGGADALAYALVQGIVPPPETEMAWLGACMAGADGWVNVCIGLRSGQMGLGLSL
ncbi:autophagy protein 5 [Auricularia subglabra TFB-10046 SS5]|uniref:Autophagy protein 5 n=1 Tax=Auricularia subglabra (strain TFB-10046 / SS5) TaxID=717982 RepID=J0WYC0_AURST|nr:autophagy protein 5 [Auricularia subglabra TFB-10046 SS5]